MRINHRKHVVAFVSFFCFFIFCTEALYVAMKSGAFADDYSFLYATQNSQSRELLDHNFREGRYLSGLFHLLGFTNVSTISELINLRIASFVGMLVICLLLLAIYRKSFSISERLFILPLVFLVPVFTQYLGFATTWIAFWSIGLAIITTECLTHENRLYQIFGVILLIVLHFFSQLLPFWVFAFLAFRFISFKSPLSEMLRLVIRAMCFQIVAAVVSQILRVQINTYLGLKGTGRIEVVSIQDLPQKIYWFISRAYISTLRPYQIGSPGIIEATLTAGCFIIAAGFLFYKVRINSSKDKLRKEIILEFLVIQSLSILSLAPLLLWSQNQIEFRLIGAGSFVSVSLLWISFVQLMRIKDNIVASIALFACVLFLVGLSHARTVELRKKPFEAKERFIANSIDFCDKIQTTDNLVLYLPEKWPTRNLLGDYSVGTDLQMDWVPKANVALNLTSRLTLKKDIVSFKVSESFEQQDSQICTIDFRNFVKVNDDLLSNSRPLRSFITNKYR